MTEGSLFEQTTPKDFEEAIRKNVGLALIKPDSIELGVEDFLVDHIIEKLNQSSRTELVGGVILENLTKEDIGQIYPYLDEKFFNLLFEVLHNEVQIAMGKALYAGVFANQRSIIDSRLLRQAEQFARVVYTEAAEWHNPETQMKQLTSMDHMKARWILDDCILRIRSQWDKLLYLLSKGYFDIKIDARELNYSLDKGKIGQLRKGAKLKNKLQQKFLDSFCTLLLQTERLKYYRDNLSHTVSEKIQNCLGSTEGELKTIDDLWELVESEHKRVQEGLIASIGVFIS